VGIRTDPSFVLAPSKWRVVAPTLRSVAIYAVLVAYGFVLSIPMPWLALYTVGLALPATVRLVAVIATLIAPAPVLAPDGLHVRASAFAPRLTVLPWSEITRVWVTYFGRRRHLAVLAARREKPYFVPVSTVAFRWLSGGAVTLADGPPTWPIGWDPDTSRRPAAARIRYGRERPVPFAVYTTWFAATVQLILIFPWAIGVQQPWNQPWWPGVAVATSAPDPCTAVSPATRRQLSVGTGGAELGRGHDVQCTFADLYGALAVRYHVANALYGSSAAKAKDIAAAALVPTASNDVPGLGDEARISASDSEAHLVIRRANVVVELLYKGGNARDGALQAGRDAANAIVLR
jgi:hypothetical protein